MGIARFPVTILSFSLLAVAAGAAGQSQPIIAPITLTPGSTAPAVYVQTAPTAAEQLKRAQDMIHKVGQVKDPQQRFAAFAEAHANLTVIRKQWPNDKGAIVRSALMQSDLGIAWNLPQNVVDDLTPVLPLVAKTADETIVERRLGQAYEHLHNGTEAEKHLLAAEQALHGAHVNIVDSEATLDAVAMFYLRQKKPREAIARFHAVADLPGQSPLLKASSALSSLQAALTLDDEPGHDTANRESQALDQYIYEARQKNLPPNLAVVVESIAAHAKRLRGH